MSRNIIALGITVGILVFVGVYCALTIGWDTPERCPALPDPAVCAQLAWLDGAWQCITPEEAG